MSKQRVQPAAQTGRSEAGIRIGAVLRVLGRVDWLRQGQRIAVFLREIRGDDSAQVESDHTREVMRARKLKDAADSFASQVIGRDVRRDDDPR